MRSPSGLPSSTSLPCIPKNQRILDTRTISIAEIKDRPIGINRALTALTNNSNTLSVWNTFIRSILKTAKTATAEKDPA